MDLFNYSRRETSEVNIGATPMGGSNPIRIQSMTNTATQDTEASVAQAKRIVDAGGEYVRLTAQGIKEAENLMNINIGLRQDGYMVPLVADIHFNPKVADVAAQYVEKYASIRETMWMQHVLSNIWSIPMKSMLRSCRRYTTALSPSLISARRTILPSASA